MPEKLHETPWNLANCLHYLGKFEEYRAVRWLARELERESVQTVQDLEYVKVHRRLQ